MKFEYKRLVIINSDLPNHPYTEELMNEMGEKGWELVAVVMDYSGSKFNHYFKRIKS